MTDLLFLLKNISDYAIIRLKSFVWLTRYFD